MNNRPILWVLLVAIALPATCVAQDSVPARGEAKNAAAPSRLSGNRSEARQELRPTAENAAESLDDFRYRRVSGQPPNPPATSGVGRSVQELEFFEDSRRTATETSAPQEPVTSTTLPIPNVLEPNGQPIEAFKIYGFSGDIVTLPAPGLPPQANAEMQGSKPLFEHKGDKLYSPPEFNLPSNVTSVLIIAPEGFKVVGRKSLLEKKPITLESISRVKGKVELNGPAVKNAFVTASWHSFPFHPELLSLPPEKRREGPGLFSVTARADLNEDGTFELAIPSGRVLFSVVQGGTNESTGTMFGVGWWDTVGSVALKDDSEPQYQQLDPRSFDLKVVKGQFKQTDALAEALTQVKQVDGRVEVTRTPLFLVFSPRSVDDENVDPERYTAEDSLTESLDQSLQAVVRRGAIWGRPGGSREGDGRIGATIPLPDNGRFSCVVSSQMAAVSLVQQNEDSFCGLSRTFFSFTDWTCTLEREETILPAQAFDEFRYLDGLEVATGVAEGEATSRSAISSRVKDAERFSTDRFHRNPNGDDKDVTIALAMGKNGFKITDLGEIDLTDFLTDTDDEWTFRPVRDDYISGEDGSFGEADAELMDRDRRSGPNDLPTSVPLRSPVLPFLNELALRDKSPAAAQQQPTSGNPTDRAIADLVARLLNTGDSRVRQTMKEPLKKLLQQRFDAEQKAREQLLEELRKRFDTATQQVKDRATKRDKIINDQLQRMLSLPEDDFEILPQQKPPERDAFGTDAAVER